MTGYTIYTDGACTNNGQANARAGWGAYLVNPEGKTLKLAAPVPLEQKQTNNRAELLAAVEALRRCTKPGPITLYSDSQLLVKGANEWLPGWKAKDWKKSDKKPVDHRDLWEQIDQFLQERDVTLIWVEGHAGHPGNEVADALADLGASGKRIQELGAMTATA
uniref:ribonuclease H n=1 Tax=Ectopseudomonas mendocina (strain ymp) TaxID=399739 RepID=A4Y094_ECTM1